MQKKQCSFFIKISVFYSAIPPESILDNGLKSKYQPFQRDDCLYTSDYKVIKICLINMGNQTKQKELTTHL